MNSFLSCDWGSSTFRLTIFDAVKMEISGEILSNEGITEIYRQWLATGKPESERIHFYRSRLADLISKLPAGIDKNIPVIISGMASSSIGLKELPYQQFPFTWDLSQFIIEKMEGDENCSHPLYIVSGFQTGNDVMRGEETQLLGCDVQDGGEKIFIFPGTHSKHVFVKNRTGVDFKTYMTGEIFNLLTEASILQNGVSKGMDEKSFAEGFKAGTGGNILNTIFQVRVRQLLQKTNPVSNYQYLNGLLIAAELKDLRDMNGPVYLVCGPHLKPGYLLGLELLGRKADVCFLPSDDMLLRGHSKIADFYL